MNILALIPAKDSSKEGPFKNTQDFCGRPLISYTIESAKNSKFINKVVVGTFDEKVAELSINYGAEVPFLLPKLLSYDAVSDYSIVRHVLDFFDKDGQIFDLIVFLRPTNLFRTANDIDSAIQKIIDTELDSIRSVSKTSISSDQIQEVKGDYLIPYLRPGHLYTKKGDIPVWYSGNGAVEVIKRDTIVKKRTMYGDRIGHYQMEDISRTEIDSLVGFKVAETLYPFWLNGEISSTVQI